MDPQVIAAIIGATATITAAIVAGVLNIRYAKKNLDESRRLNEPDQGRQLPSHVEASSEIIECIESEIANLRQKKSGQHKRLDLKFIGAFHGLISLKANWKRWLKETAISHFA